MTIRRAASEKAQCGVLSESDRASAYTPLELAEIRHILADTGYAFDPRQNIFYSILNPWQRKLGYCSFYDEASTPIGLVFDSEPIRFEYGGKMWMIEFWKGQYGITTGGEIGIYTKIGPEADIIGLPDATFYNCAEDEDHLSMAYTLLKNDEVLFNRAARHWWLTGFMLGEYAEPSDLSMEISITFKNMAMRDAFLSELFNIGYTESEVRYGSNTVLILFTQPHSKQPLTRNAVVSAVAMQTLHNNVEEYRKIVGVKSNMYDILTAVKEESPLLYDLILKMGRQEELYRQFESASQLLK
jgi:hypothetical protein